LELIDVLLGCLGFFFDCSAFVSGLFKFELQSFDFKLQVNYLLLVGAVVGQFGDFAF
jgi:hypothetical protein